MPYIPHTRKNVQDMLEIVDVSSTEALFDEIPPSLRFQGFHDIPSGKNEMAMMKEAANLAAENRNAICFMGAGSYEHFIPAAVWDIASRGEFLTAYTPYQAEASQGILQLLYEFQTMIAELTAMEVANASLYDGASALAEALLMAMRLGKGHSCRQALIAESLHPFYRETLETIAGNQSIELITLPFDREKGTICLQELDKYHSREITALIVPQPNFFGCLEPVHELTDWARENHIMSIACVNPLSLGLLAPPGEWGKQGVDIACGEAQPLGIPMASGGPGAGFFCTRMEFVRQMPGRLAGRTLDKEGNPGFTLTLQAREQHIRRGRATSNICTNQGLLVTAATIYLSLTGPQGLQNIASLCHHNTLELVDRLSSLSGVRAVFSSPFFHECLLQFDKPLDTVLQALDQAGIKGGYPVESHHKDLANTLLVCATEMRSSKEIQLYANTIEKLITWKK